MLRFGSLININPSCSAEVKKNPLSLSLPFCLRQMLVPVSEGKHYHYSSIRNTAATVRTILFCCQKSEKRARNIFTQKTVYCHGMSVRRNEILLTKLSR